MERDEAVSVPGTGTLDETRLDSIDEALDRIELPPGSTVHRYVVLGTLGAGATGVVYAAYDPELDRKIAIKVLHRLPSDGTRDDERDQLRESRRVRMLREAQALARLRHPNIVSVHDVGRIDDQLFIAMEYVEGETLGRWARAQPRSTREIIDVYAMAGRGLAAAHADGLVHRDFKPDNVIVDLRGMVRVLDFGLARATEEIQSQPPRTAPHVAVDDDGTGPHRVASSLDTNVTRDGVLVGTPAYMAPEQHLRLPATPASDQFAFCVALYEALYGERPFAGDDLAALSANVIAGRIRANSPSAGVPARVRRALERGLAAEPSARWPDMSALVETLSHDPRPRRRLAAAGVGVLVLGGVCAAALWPASVDPQAACQSGHDRLTVAWADHRAQVRETFAATELPYAQAAFVRVDAALQRYATRWQTSWDDACAATHVDHQQSPAALDRRLACLDRSAVAFEALGEVLSEPGSDDHEAPAQALDAATALPSPEDCSALAAVSAPVETLDPKYRDELDGLLARARALDATGDYERAEQVAKTLLARATEIDDQRHQALAHELIATIVDQEDDTKTSVAHLRNGYLSSERSGDDELRATFARRLAVTFGTDAKQRELGEAWLARAEALHERAQLGDRARVDLAFVEGRILLAASELEPAIERLRASASLAEQIAPEQPLAGRAAWSALATAYRDQARYDEAREIDERLLVASREHYGETHPETALAITNLGNTLHLSGDHAAAVEVFERALEATAQTFGEDSVVYANRLNNYAASLDKLGRRDEALAAYERALEIGEARWGSSDKRIAPYLENLGTVYTARGEHERAHEFLARSHDIRVEAYGPDHPVTALNDLNFGWAKFKLGRHDEALDMLRHGLSVWERKLGEDYADNGIFHNNIGDVLRHQGRCTEAVPQYKRAIALFEPTYGDDYPELLYPLTGLGLCRAQLGEPDAGRTHLERALAVSPAGDYPAGYLASANFGLARLIATEDPERAVELARAALVDAKEEPKRPQAPLIEAWLARSR